MAATVEPIRTTRAPRSGGHRVPDRDGHDTDGDLPVLLLAPETFDLAETSRMLEVARACRGRFRIEFMCYGGRFVGLVEDAGYRYHRLEPQLTADRIDELGRALRMERGGRMFTAEELAGRVRGELDLYARLSPAAIVTGFILSAYLSARVAGIPLVTVAPLAVTRPFFEAGLACFPERYDAGPMRLVPARLKDRAANWWGLHTRQWLGPFNRVARDYGLQAFRRLVDLVEADEMLITNIPAIVGLDDLPPHWRYVGPIYAHLEGGVPAALLHRHDGRPLVYFSLGSLPNLEILDLFLEALGRLPVRVVAPIGEQLRRRPAPVPDNVTVYDWLPAHRVNPLVDVAVIHGGEGTVQTACASGIPFVGIGFTPEQETNIGFLVRWGTAVRARRRDIDAATLGRAIGRLLQPEVRGRAKELSRMLQSWDGPSAVADFLEDRYGAIRTAATGPETRIVPVGPRTETLSADRIR